MADNLGAAEGSIRLDAAEALASLSQVGAGLQKLDAQSKQWGNGWERAVQKNAQALNTVGLGLVGVGTAIVGAFGFSTKTMMDFEAQVSAVGSVSGASKSELAALREEALRLGADTTFSASEAAQAMEILAKAGAPLDAILNGATEAVLNLSAATGVSVPLSAETAATAMNIFGVSAEEAADTIAQSANASALDVNDWALALKSAGPVAASLGLDMEDLAQAMVILGDAGIKGETGATALRNILMGLADPAGDAAVALNEMGVATHDAQGNFRGLEEVTHDLAGAWGEMDAAQKLQIATMVAGEQGAASFIALMDAQAEAVRNGSDAFQESSERMDATGTAAEQAQARMDNLKGSFEQLKGTIETLMITFTSGLAPAMRAGVDALNRVLQLVLSLPPGVKTAIAALTGIVGVTSLVAGGFLLALPRIVDTRNALRDLAHMGGPVGSLVKPLTSLRGALTALRAGLLGLATSPVILGALAVALAGVLAYRTNFLGFRDMVDSVRHAVGMLGETFARFRALGQNPVSAALNAIGTALRTFDIGILTGLANKLGVVATALQDFWSTFQQGGGKQTIEIGADIDPMVIEWQEQEDGTTKYALMHVEDDGSVTEVGKILKSWDDESDPNLIHAKVEVDGQEYDATIDRATGETTIIPMEVEVDDGPVLSFFNRLDAGLAAMQDRLNAGGATFLANIVGAARHAVDGIEWLHTALNNLDPAIQNWIIGIGAGLAALKPLASIGRLAFSPLISGIKLAIGAIGLLLSPIGLVVAAIALLAVGAIYLYRHFEPFRRAVDAVAKALANFAKGPALDFLKGLGEGLADALDGLTNFLDGVEDMQDFFSDLNRVIDRFRIFMSAAFASAAAAAGPFRETIQRLGAVFDSLLAAGQSALTAIAALLRGDWAAAWDAAVDTVQNVVSAVGSYLLALGQLIVDTFQAIDWGALWSGLLDSIAGIDYGAIASGIGDGVQAALGALRVVAELAVELLANVIDGIGSAASSAWDWIKANVPGWVAGVIDGAIPALTKAASIVASLIGVVLDGLGGLASDAWGWIKGNVSGWVGSLIDGSIAALSKAASIVANVVGSVVDALSGAASGMWAWIRSKLTGWVKSLTTGDPEAVERNASILTNLIGSVTDSISGGIASVWDWIKNTLAPGWLKSLITAAPNALTRNAQMFANILGSLIDTISAGFASVWDWVKSKLRESGSWLLKLWDGLEKTFTITFGIGLSVTWPDVPEMPAELKQFIADPLGLGNSTLLGALEDNDASLFPAFGHTGDLDKLREQAAGGQSGASGLSRSNLFSGLLGGGDALGQQFAAAVSAAIPAMQAALDGVRTGTIIPQAAAWIGAMATGLAPLGPIATVSFGAVTTSAVAQLGMAAASVASNTSAMSATTAANLGAMAANGVSRAASMAAGVTSSLSGMRGTSVSTVSSMGSAVASSITTMGTTSAAQVLGMRMGIAASMLTMSSSATNAANSARAGVVSAFTSMALQAASAVSNGIGRIPGIIGSYAGAARSAGYSVGNAAGAGIVAGLNSMLGAAQAAAAAIVNTVMVAMAAAAALGSPSKITTKYGAWIGEGLVIGLDRMQRAVRQSADLLGRNAIPGVGAVNPYLSGAPYGFAAGSGSTSYQTIYGSTFSPHVNFEPGSIVQQPGEDMEAFADRVVNRTVRAIWDGYAAAGDGGLGRIGS